MLAKTPITDQYLTAAELGITEAERKALIWVRDELASGRIEHDVKSARPHTFNMLDFEGGDCGTVRCVGGWMVYKLKSYDLSETLSSIFYPGLDGGLDYSKLNINIWDLTPVQAVRAIDFWATGHQQDCWALALSDA